MRRASSSLLLFLIVAAVVLYFFWNKTSTPNRRTDRTFSSYPREARTEHRRSERSERKAEVRAECSQLDVTCSSEYFGPWQRPGVGDCSTRQRGGYPIPDPRCTPGGIDPSVTADVLRNRAWRTGCIRNCETSEAEKHITYRWYGIRVRRRNYGETQVCELDHLVPLELGGADGLGNIWPECGPSAVALDERYFKIKDRVENYLADEVKSGRMTLAGAQRGIATDWTQYLDAANRYCAAGRRCD
jgi:hypothetical protein